MEEVSKTKSFWKRRKFLINEHFQLHFIGFVGILSLGACVAFYLAAEYFFMKYHGFAIDVGLRPSDPFFKVLSNMEVMLTYIFAVVSISVIIVSIVGGLLFSHKAVGPMYSLRRHLEAVSRGETLDDVHFRKGDYFADVAEACNSQLRYFRQRLGVETWSGGNDVPVTTYVSTTSLGTEKKEADADVGRASEESKKAS